MILNKPQLTVEPGEVRWWGTSGRSVLGGKGEATLNLNLDHEESQGRKFPCVLSRLFPLSASVLSSLRRKKDWDCLTDERNVMKIYPVGLPLK